MNLKKKLHLAQLEVYYGQLINPKSPIYNIGGYVVLTGDLNKTLFKDVIGSLSSVFDTYNFKYDFKSEEPLFYIDKTAPVYLSELDFSLEKTSEEKAKEWMQEQMDTPFDLQKEKWFGHTLIKIANNIHWWFGYCHHLVHDGYGFAIMSDYVIEEYDKRYKEENINKGISAPSYFKLAERSNEYLTSKEYEKDAIYWREKYGEIPDSVINYKKKNKIGGERLSMVISKSDRELFRRLSKETKANLSQFTLAALLIYYGKTTNQKTFSFGIPVHNRASREERKTLGMFSSVLPFKGEYDSDKVVTDFISEIKQTQRNDYRHRKYPVSHLNRTLQLLSENQQQVFDIVINYEPFPFPKSLSSGLHVAIKHLSTVADLEDPLSFRWCDYGEDSSLILNIDFLHEYFERVEIEQLSERLLFILRQFEDGITKPLKNISIVPQVEKDQLLSIFNNTKVKFPSDKTILNLFESQALKTPDKIAVIYEETSISYKELEDRSNQLAHYINNNYTVQNDLIGVFIQRNIDLIVSFLGVLKSGKAFVPIDTSYPKDRIKHIVKDSSLELVVTDSIVNQKLISEGALQKLILDKEYQTIGKEPKSKLEISISKHDIAYVIYTSGTTGKPKGVVVNHIGLTNVAFSWRNLFEVNENTCLLQLASYAFDVFIGDVCKSLLFGGQMIICPDNTRFDLAGLYKLIKQHQVTLFETTPALGVPLMDFIYENNLEYSWIKQVILGSDICHIHDFRRLYERFANTIRITNSYGVTEATIDSSYYEAENLVSLSLLSNVPIGKPLDNMQFYVLDQTKNLVPKGVIGELYIGGLGLAKEYLNNSELTQEKFVSNPFKEDCKLYKTGDLARWLPDGNIDFIGRGDSQVKIRGYRIELGEIENVLFRDASISNCCVLVKEDSNEGKYLVGYVVSEGGFNKKITESFLKESLPSYMVPTLWVVLDKMPLTANGKLDKKSLPEPDFISLSSKSYIAPRNPIEKQLVIIWQELLGIEKIGVNENFFELGGHSLLVIRFVNRLQKLGYKIDIKNIFSDGTIAGISEKISISEPVYKVPANGITIDTTYIVPSMVPLLDFNQKDIDKIVESIPSGVSNIQDIYPLSPLQEGIYFQHLLSNKSVGDPYVTPVLLSFANKEKRKDFIEALQFIVNRHDVLRTCFLNENLPSPVQIVLREVSLPVEELIIDASENILLELQTFINSGNHWLDVSIAPLLKLLLVDDKKNNKLYILLLAHHLVLDHVGLEKLISEIKKYLSKKEVKLPEPDLYRDFIGRILHQQETNDSELFYKKIVGSVEEPTYPFELSNIRGSGNKIKELKSILPKKLSNKIRNISIDLGISPAVLFHAAYGIVIGKCSNSEYALFGSLFSGRLEGASDSLGLFINTLPFFIELKGNVLEYVEEVNKRLREYLSFEQTSLSSIQSWSGISNEVPLFSALLNYRHSSTSFKIEEDINLGVSIIEGYERTNYPFVLNVDDYGVDFGLIAQVEKTTGTEKLLDYIQEVLIQLIKSLELKEKVPVAEVSILPKSEIKLLQTFNNTTVNYPQKKTIIDLFIDQAKKTPNDIAIVFEGKYLTYLELDKRSNQLAHYLLENQKVCKEDIIGVALERSDWLIISYLSILKTGAAYLPIDPEYPKERKEYIYNNSGCTFIIDNSYVQILKETISDYPENTPSIKINLSDLAYIIYTSGSTGKPKGVMVEHRNLIHLCFWHQSEYSVNKLSRGTLFSSIGFDASVWEIYPYLISGASLYPISEKNRFDLGFFSRFLQENEITHAYVPTLLCESLIEEDISLPNVTILTGGDTLSINKIPHLTIYNNYGPTETTVVATNYKVIEDTILTKIPIGKPIDNTQIYITDSVMNLVPKGVVGELCIGGLGVARGYLNNEELTKEKFITNPFKQGSKLYKTGDLAKWLADGNIEFIGRKDNQVKVRGYRIELEEIENILSNLTSVIQSCVLAKEDGKGNKRLIGYVVVKGKLNRDLLQQKLEEYLPSYMVPRLWIELEKMPLTSNGKLDKKSLSNLDETMLLVNEYVAPRNEIEEQLVTIWQELLGVEKIGIYDNFFELGGHSLLATRLVSKVRKKLAVEIAIQNIFKFTTIDEIACYIEHKQYTLKYKEKEYNINIEL